MSSPSPADAGRRAPGARQRARAVLPLPRRRVPPGRERPPLRGLQRGELGLPGRPVRRGHRHRRDGRRGRPRDRRGRRLDGGPRDLRPLRPLPPAARRVRPAGGARPPRRARGRARHDHARRAPAARVRPRDPRPAPAATARPEPEALGRSPSPVSRRRRSSSATSGTAGSSPPRSSAALVAGITEGSLSDAQAAAFAMAVYFRGMTWEECAAFTQAMARSGTVLDWSGAGLEGPILDKHSTGGVGDTVSLILAPLVAACGGVVPMISGRGLGHTGGTLDKLASIPGYEMTPGLDRFRSAVRDAGCAIVGPPRSWRRRTGGSTRSATSRPPSTRSRSSRRRSSRRSWRPASTRWSWT